MILIKLSSVTQNVVCFLEMVETAAGGGAYGRTLVRVRRDDVEDVAEVLKLSIMI